MHCDLSHCDLSHCDLSHCDLSHCAPSHCPPSHSIPPCPPARHSPQHARNYPVCQKGVGHLLRTGTSVMR
ncbi:pentapeptide repeat-containing protein [Stieleria sp.]|uniref:pentapeptide repeat-containing protein n=1 Tax=Stieleria sp. TaxID=2795976 RepID=UPI00356A3B3F